MPDSTNDELRERIEQLFMDDDSWSSDESRLYDHRVMSAKIVQLIHQHTEQAAQKHDADIDKLLAERDSLEDRLDSLSNAVGAYFSRDMGEHSSENDPWYNAFEMLRDNTRDAQLTTKHKGDSKDKRKGESR